MQTPISIVPEFYLLPFYAILRAIPNKLLGVVAMLASILILLLLPLLESSRVRSSAFRPFMRFSFWLFVVNFLLLMWIGSNHPEPPYILLGQLCTAFYFAYFLILVPLLGLIENTLSDLGTNYSSTPSNSQKFPLFYLFFTLKSKEFHRLGFPKEPWSWTVPRPGLRRLENLPSSGSLRGLVKLPLVLDCPKARALEKPFHYFK